MELFDRRFVHFMWDDELKGKTGIMSNDIKCLRDYVNNKSCVELIEHSSDESQPFQTTDGIRFRFAYYDPNYEVKKAFNEGKEVQMKVDGFWANCDKPDFEDGEEYRVKPDEEKCIVYLDRLHDYLTACIEYRWESAQKQYHAKTKLFVGTESEVEEWYKSRQKFAEAIKAWEDGKTIQIHYGNCEWANDHDPCWDVSAEYRVKPEEEKKYRSYESSAEMIVDFIDRFKVKCPSYCEPLIWLGTKQCPDHHFLITGFALGAGIRMGGTLYSFEDLFNDYRYLDGSPVGKECRP